jgi:hypothetical protein
MMHAPDGERGELQSIARYAARRVKHYEHLLEQHQQEVRVRERLYRERERRALEMPLPPKQWSMRGLDGEQARPTAAIRTAREYPAEAVVGTPDSELANAS